MSKLIILLCTLIIFACGNLPNEPKYPEPEIIYIYQDDNPIEFTVPQIQTFSDGFFTWMLCRNKSDSVWYGHPEIKLENSDSPGNFKQPCEGYLTTKYDFNAMAPVDTIQSIQAGQQVEAWIYCPHDWGAMPRVYPWISFVTDN